MKWILSVFLMASFSVQAEVATGHIESMLDQMVKENVISSAEAEKAKIRLKTMSPQQWKEVNQKAALIAARMPASVESSANRIEEVRGIDLDGAQFKEIQNEMKKIVPQYKD